MLMAASALAPAVADDFKYTDEQFADIQMLRYKVAGFDQLSLRQKTLVYYLSEAALQGRDILFDQNGRYNLRIRRLLEAVYTDYKGDRDSDFYRALTVYLKRVWFSNGIHHHYGSEKFVPGFTEADLRAAVRQLDPARLRLPEGQTVDAFCDELFPVIFDPTVMPMRVNQRAGDDLVLTSAGNYYGPGVTQEEAEAFYTAKKDLSNPRPVMMGLNSRLVKQDGRLTERVWRSGGLYGQAIDRIIACLEKARPFADTPEQAKVIDKLIEYYRTGDLHTFDDYCILWLNDTKGTVDFVNGFTETYGDPLGMKASWESIVNFKDHEATLRTEKLSANAQWFEDHSPVDARFKKEECRGISAKVITAAMLGGDLYPSTAIGINLPNSDWVRREHGSKSVTIGNLTAAYNHAAHGSGMDAEFVIDDATRQLIARYGDACDELHTDLHECLGHGSGQLAPGVKGDELKQYGSVLEEARADLFSLYYMADPKMEELGLLPDAEVAKAQYASYISNGMMTQLARVELGKDIEQTHMRNRKMISEWAYELGRRENVIEKVVNDRKTYIVVNDFDKLRTLFGKMLREVQRIKSEGDFVAGRDLVERYGVKVDRKLHEEVLERYGKLGIQPYSGFVNPIYTPVMEGGEIVDIIYEYPKSYTEQMLDYSSRYSFLPSVN